MTAVSARLDTKLKAEAILKTKAERFVAAKAEESPDRIEHPAVESTDGGNFMRAVTENDRCTKVTGTPTGTARPQQG